MMIYAEKSEAALADHEWKRILETWISQVKQGEKILILPPDITRCYSYAGKITAYLYEKLSGECKVRIMPAVGTHRQMTREERIRFFGAIPDVCFLSHNWKNDTEDICIVPEEIVSEATGGTYRRAITAELNRNVLSGEFDRIVSIGQVVPHEVVGMANYTKNLLVGVGGRDMINQSHMISAICGIEKIMGRENTPVRRIFDYVQKNFLDQLKITFMLTVTCEKHQDSDLYGFYIGEERETFSAACRLAEKKNITWLPKRAKKIVTWLDPAEFGSTWVGNKAVYRTRMAIADGGELLILAPGIKSFGENEEVDSCIRKYGYSGTETIQNAYENGEFNGIEMAAAHLILKCSKELFTDLTVEDLVSFFVVCEQERHIENTHSAGEVYERTACDDTHIKSTHLHALKHGTLIAESSVRMDLDLVGAACALFYELSEFLSTYLETVLLVYGRTKLYYGCVCV